MWLPDEPFSVAAAASEDEFAALWRALGQAEPEPEVDFERELVLFLGMSGSSSCPEEFVRLVVDGVSRVFAEWVPLAANRACTDDLQAQGLLVAVDRAALPAGQFQLSLREQPICPDCASHPDQAIVDPTAE